MQNELGLPCAQCRQSPPGWGGWRRRLSWVGQQQCPSTPEMPLVVMYLLTCCWTVAPGIWHKQSWDICLTNQVLNSPTTPDPATCTFFVVVGFNCLKQKQIYKIILFAWVSAWMPINPQPYSHWISFSNATFQHWQPVPSFRVWCTYQNPAQQTEEELGWGPFWLVDGWEQVLHKVLKQWSVVLLPFGGTPAQSTSGQSTHPPPQ